MNSTFGDKLELTNEEIRVLGVLLEKEKTTPDNYPLTLNSLILACNQTTNRHPIVNYDEMIVERALGSLRERGLALRGVYAGSRVPKHRHHMTNVFEISESAQAVLCILMLRGAQTLGEIKARTDRMCDFESLEDCDLAIEELVSHSPALAYRVERQPGQKEGRINHCFGELNQNVTELESVTKKPSFQLIEGEGNDSNMLSEDEYNLDESENLLLRIDNLESEVSVLTHEIMALRAEVDALRDPSA